MWLVTTVLNVANIIEHSVGTLIFYKDISDHFSPRFLQKAGLEVPVAGQTDQFLS